MNNIIDAASRSHIIPWRHINWHQANKTVNRLQSRIVKALQEGNQRKVRALQNLLTRSFSASALAVRRVIENTGKRTPGVDRKLWKTHQEKTVAVQKVRKGQYRAKPLRRIYIPKPGKDEKRPLSIPCMDDRAKQALHLMALDPIAEYYADENSYGFRKKRSTMDAIQACFIFLSQKYSAKWVLEGDIKGCFNNISHDWLMKWIPMDKQVLKQWLKAGYIEKQVLYSTDQGTPQGGIASPTLANLTLDGLEKQLKLQFKNQKVNFVRYADDFIITGNSQSLLEDKIKPTVEKFLAIRGLSLSKEKTKITHIKEGFDFLGFNLQWVNDKFIIKPTKASVQKVRKEIKQVIKSSGALGTAKMIIQLNAIIRGWANYYKYFCSYKAFSYLDNHVWQMLWHWVKRRHPRKGLRWIKKQYFKTTKESKWNFCGKRSKDNKTIFLLKFNKFKREKHIKIRKEANPYDSAYVTYFENRRRAKTFAKSTPSKVTRALWSRQKGLCLLCKEEITAQTGWHQHHVTYRRDGGKNDRNNLALLHPICHDQWHQRDNECNAGLSKKVFGRA